MQLSFDTFKSHFHSLVMRKWVLWRFGSVAQAQPAQLGSLVRGDAVRYKITQGVMVSLCISGPDCEMRMLGYSYEGRIWHKTHFRMTRVFKNIIAYCN